MKLVTVNEMRKIEREADASGLTYAQMMENAGRGVSEEILYSYSHLKNKIAFALVGSGNNGGDALVALSYLSRAGWETAAYIVKKRESDDPLIDRLKADGGQIFVSEDDVQLEQFKTLVKKSSIIIDGVLGTGIKLPLKPYLANKLHAYKEILSGLEYPPKVIAVDCPSGVDSDNGEVAPDCIPADMTVTMAAVKSGLLAFPAGEYTGELRVASIGEVNDLKSWQSSNKEVATQDQVRKMLPTRPADSHKGTFGTALVIGGSVNYTGAVLLAGEAAYRGGAGLVTIALPAVLHQVVAGHLPEATWILLPEEMGVISESGSKIILDNLDRVDAMLVGPGFGLEDTSRGFIAGLIGYQQKEKRGELGFVKRDNQPDRQEVKLPALVVDADGLKLLSQIDGWYQHIPNFSILTPHPGEMAVLTGLDIHSIQTNRLGVAKEYAEKWKQIVVLKGAYTVIAAPDGHLTVIPIATPALATAGTGDVLAGLILGLRAQGVSSYDAAVAGAWIHARSGLVAAQKLRTTASVLAGDVLRSIIDVMSEFN